MHISGLAIAKRQVPTSESPDLTLMGDTAELMWFRRCTFQTFSATEEVWQDGLTQIKVTDEKT
jgi:hypothetical protein